MEIDKLIKEKTVIVGKWWFGTNRRRQFTGTLKFDNPITLDISGTSDIDLNEFLHPKVTGSTPEGEYFILLDNFVSRTSSHLGGSRAGRWSMSLQPSDILYFTKHSDSRWKTTTLTHFESRIPYFDFWLDDQLFDSHMQEHTITFTERNERPFELDGVKLIFSTHLFGLGGGSLNTRNKLKLKQVGHLRLEYAEEVEYTEAIKYYRQLEGFFRLAYANQFFVKSFSGFFMRHMRYRGHQRPYLESKDIYQNRIIDKKLRLPSGMIDELFLFKFRTLDDPEATIRRWLEIEPALAPVYQLLFSSLESGIYIEQRFLNLVNALEIFHRRFRNRTRKSETEWEAQKARILVGWHGGDRTLVKRWLRYANEVSLEERLIDLVSSANNTGFRGMMPETIKSIADTRNNFVHEEFGGTRGNLDLALSNEALTEILLISILQELNFTTQKIHQLTLNRWIFRYSNR